jgi:uncharacterized membrane protein
MDKLIQMKYGRRAASVAISIILLVASFGMYLGRFLRFNSWDVFYDHMSLLENIWKIFSQPENYKNAYIFTGVAFLFLYISYKAFKYSTSETKPSI